MTTAAPRRHALAALVLVAISLALAAAGQAAADSYNATVLADQPVAYWRLGELGGLTAFDSAPWHYDAQLVGTTPTSGALYTDPGNGAQSLDGSSKIVSSQDWSWLGGAPASGGVRNHSFSLEFWMKPAVIDSRFLWVISEQDKAPVRQGWAVMLTQQPGQPVTLSYERWADGSYVGGVVYRNDNAALKNAIDVGKWTHVLVNYDGDTTMGGQNKLRLYVNGVLVHTTTAQPANMVKITQPFRAGQGDDPASQPGFVGAIDELALYGGAVWDAAAHYKAAFIAPQNTVAPSFSGTAVRGQTLTGSSGTWTGGPAPTLALQWQRCAADGTSCAAIAGANGTSYTVADADAGSTLRLSVTGSNGGGAVTVTTPVSALVHGAVPANTAAPSISGSGAVGDALTASSGTWTGVPAPTFAYQWQRCNSAGALCSDLPGATTSTYTPTVSDTGAKLVVRVTGSNFEGSATAASAPFAVATASSGGGSTTAAPANTAVPTISGNPLEGATLTASPGTWSNSPTSFAYQWRRCGSTCADVAGANGSTYVVGSADVGSSLAVVVTATNAGGSASATSATTAPVGSAVQAPAPPVATAQPTISGQPVEGAAVTASTGTWTGSPTSFAYQWQRCGSTCADVPGATAASYSLSSADVGSTVAVTVTATGPGGSASSSSAAFGPVTAAAPVSTAAPVVSGSTVVGSTLSATAGSWKGSNLTFAYQWQRCGASCLDVATGSSYTLGAADVGFALQVVVTATNAGGSASAQSAQTAKVVPAAPVSTAAPVVSGSTVVGSTLSATAGSWTGSNVTYAYQWQRCDGTCVDVATGSSYTLAAADVGFALQVVVTATNAGGSASAESAQTAKVVPAAPVSTAAPVVSGTAVEGSTLSATAGTWTGSSLTYAYEWKRCDATCVDVATGSSYLLGAADVGFALQVVVTATNAGGSATAQSAQTAKVLPAKPEVIANPTVFGPTVEGSTLNVTAGAWAGTNLTYSYKWQRCDATCVDVGTGVSYTLGAADVGFAFQAVVTATNAGGSTTAQSDRTAKVVPAAPVSQAAPVVSGTALAGSTLTATPGTWSGSGLAYAYQWQRCAGGTCADVQGANTASYVLAAADVDATFTVTVTATNGGGSAVATSSPVGPVKAVAPASTAAPVVTGTAAVGQTLTASTGSWSGTGPLAYAYAWQRCDAAGAACASIDGATASAYVPVAADAGSTLRVLVTAANSAGSASAPSATVGPVAGVAPANSALPTVAGTAAIGQTLTATAGTWDGTPTPALTYQWLGCTAAGCQPIAGATAPTYLVRPADYGSSLRVDVTAKNSAGSATASSATTAAVADTIAPTLAISTVATGGISIAGWNVSLLLTAGVTASDAESGLAGDPTCTVDGRGATLKDAGDGAWTVSVVGLGSHTVACAVADKAGNRTTASATVKTGGARELEQSLLAQVNRALATATPRDAAKLAKAADALGDALAPANWADANHLVASRGRVVFDANQDAAGSIVDLIKDKQSQVPDATSVSWLLTIAQVDRVLAATAVADAISTKAAKAKTDDAKDELDKSETAAVRGDTTSSLVHFENAWRKAQK